MVVVIDSGGANITSVMFALKRLQSPAILTTDSNKIKQAEKIILPGVGSAHNAMKLLENKNLITTIKQLTQPVLGICLGMQLLYEQSAEGDTLCLGIIPGEIKKIPSTNNLPVPHMGWNEIKIKQKTNKLLQNIKDNSFCYFIHSYYAQVTEYTVASTEYSVPITAIVQKDNFYGCQFHPEKSSSIGEQILRNFLELTT